MVLNDTLDIFEDKKNGIIQVRSKSSVMAIEFAGEEEREIFEESLSYLRERGAASAEKLIDRLARRYDRDKVCFVVNELRDYGIVEEHALRSRFNSKLREQLNFWSQASAYPGAKPADEIQEAIKETRLGLAGTGNLLSLLAEKARLSGFARVSQFETATTADWEKIVREQDFLIVAADDWDPNFLEKFNQLAAGAGKPWILVRGMDGSTASVGPLFVGRDTGCYHCLSSRQKSNMEHLPYFKAYEAYLKSQGRAARSEGGPMAAYDFMASVAVLEAVKYLTGWAVPAIYGAYITLDIFDYDLQTHPFLRSPVCPVCKPELDFSPAPWLEPISINSKP